MKTLITVFLAGAMAVSVTKAGVNDELAEERYRAKYGRYTPAEEARRAAAEQAKRNGMQCCAHDTCCRHTLQEVALQALRPAPISAEFSERMRAKFGHSLYENALGAPHRVVGSQDTHSPQVPPLKDSEARLQAKTGRAARVPAGRSGVIGKDVLAQATDT